MLRQFLLCSTAFFWDSVIFCIGPKSINCWVCVSFALKNKAISMHNLYLFICIFIYISINSIKLIHISTWTVFYKLAAYFRNTFQGVSGYLIDLFIILLLFFTILHCTPLLIEKVKRYSQKQSRVALWRFFVANHTINLYKKTSMQKSISKKVAWQTKSETVPELFCVEDSNH